MAVLFAFSTVAFFSCSSKDAVVKDDRSFVTNADTDYFINRDGTVDIMLTGAFDDGNKDFGNVVRRAFVYGTTSKPTVNSSNTAIAVGPANVSATLKNLNRNSTYFIRAFLEMNDGSFFYGNEIHVSTQIDASQSRSMAMEMITPKTIAIEATSIDAALRVLEVEKESPIELGIQYSLNSDFTDAMTLLADNLVGNVSTTSYFADATNLTPATDYHFRPYARYADGSLTYGGTHTIVVRTTN
ncbi:hypothetical protein DWB61_06100 [Ancylomarina euxinus]|uniref:Uncharacterized protein n=2 Tax=Ancylomarina euxinus TaxID=2283627 RepID=A0A425Y484_9BACT|nr:hypothetical protein DWB61_06100 [Ancylomarina euxinus]